MDRDRVLAQFVDAPIREGRRERVVQPLRLIFSLAIMLGLGALLVPCRDELLFHFSSAEPLDLGDAAQLQDPLPVGRFVRLTGHLGNKAATLASWRPGSLRMGPILVRQVLGAPVFLELDQERWLSTMNEPFAPFTVEGRLVDFGPDGELSSVRRYFQSKLGLEVPPGARLLIVDERPGEMHTYVVAFAAWTVMTLVVVVLIARALSRRVVASDDDLA